MVNWSQLPNELLICVAEHIKKLEDFIAFGAVCKGWHAAGKKQYFKGLWIRQGTPYLMLRDSDDSADDTCRFYGMVENEIVASIRISKIKSKKCLESLGWLLVGDKDGSMCLLNPFSSVEIPVPHQRTFLQYKEFFIDGHVYVEKMVLSARPSATCDFILMVICCFGYLAFWRPGDQSWNEIKIPSNGIRDVVYHGGHFYAVGGGCAWVFTIERDNPPMFTCLMDIANVNALHERANNYLCILKTSQSLFLISRTAPYCIGEDSRYTFYQCKYHVYEVDTSAGTWVEINNIGSMAIFVGHNETFAFDTSRFPGTMKGNRIYFTNDGWGVYNMETDTFEMCFPEQVLLSKACRPIWITPCF